MRPLTSWARRRKALSEPFPDEWRTLLASEMAHWQMLDEAERARLEDLIRLILLDKLWEATDGFELTEEIRVVISAMAGLLILGLDYDDYHDVTSIIVGPSTMVDAWTYHEKHPLRVLGETPVARGPVLVAWDEAQRNARHPERGYNVVYHEFAHKLDSLDDVADGAPPHDSADAFQHWVDVCAAEFRQLQEGHGHELIDPYAATNAAEFFAVVTEVFFDRPIDLEREKSELYGVLRDFYRQDPAARERRHRGVPAG